ncbi:hypothetical protein RDV89_07585 [Nocardioides zeae]|uniref:Uncharacterized protein n=1 Tax=Nocardioides imazamoxiresistens TaxID=3231893 RepID=A0ABU3PUM4_9ACTN|nr:hypothetical protein [Nocardioides zeae]MDT9592925.1 hypothetical protein [Nocardioides zeae]
MHVVDSHYVPPPDGLRLVDEWTVMAGLTPAEQHDTTSPEAEAASHAFHELLPLPGFAWVWRALLTDDWHVWHTDPDRLEEQLAPIRAAHPSVRWVVHHANFDRAGTDRLIEERSLNGIPGLMHAHLRNDGSGLAISMYPDFPEADLPAMAERIALLDLPMPAWIEIFQFPDREPDPSVAFWFHDETRPFDGR